MPDNLDDSYEELSGDDYLGLDNKTLIEFNYYIDQMLDDLDSDRIDEKTSVTTSIFNTVRSQCDNYPENGPLIWAFIQESCHDFYKNKLQKMYEESDEDSILEVWAQSWQKYSRFAHRLTVAFSPIDEMYFMPKEGKVIAEEAMAIIVPKKAFCLA